MVCANKYDDGFYKWFNNRTYILVMMGMTEKRFTCEVTDTGLWYIETITDNFEMNTFDDVETVTELLNKFSEENKELKVTEGEMEDYLARMEEENKELKKQLTLAKPLYSRRELEKENKELKAFKEKVFEWIDGEIDSVKESCTTLMTSDEAEAVMDTLIELKNELSGGKND